MTTALYRNGCVSLTRNGSSGQSGFDELPVLLGMTTATRSAITTNDSLLLTDIEAAPLLGVAPATLRSWRCRGIGPAYLKFAGLRGGVRYDVRDIAEYKERCRHTPSMRAAFEGR
jgi:hypothetical protein